MSGDIPVGSSALARLQSQLQQAILLGDQHLAGSGIESAISAADGTALTRVGVYSTAYRLRLTEALGANFPRLRQLTGADSFALLARSFIDQHPSQHVSVRWFGHALVDYLQCRGTEPWLVELAQWEWALAEAFDAADAVPLHTDALASIPAHEWPRLRFLLHPSLHRLTLRTNAVGIFKALDEGTAPPPPAVLSSQQPWLVWRSDFDTRFRSSSEDEGCALDVLTRHGTFAALCDALCARMEPEQVPARAASLLKTWVTEGLIVGCSVPEAG